MTKPSNITGRTVRAVRPLEFSSLTIHRTTAPRDVPQENSIEHYSLSYCTDHMLTAQWTDTDGWKPPSIVPYGPLTLAPIASVLHYATTCFEGMKVYRGVDGKLRMFRPHKNAERFRRSAARVALPDFDATELVKLIKALIMVEAEKWLGIEEDGPSSGRCKEKMIYMRPTLFATQAAIGVQRPREAMLVVVMVLFPNDLGQPLPAPPPPATNGAAEASQKLQGGNGMTKKRGGMKLLASNVDMIRAWPGGFGSYKVGANYGPSIVAHGEALERGYQQVLWLFGEEEYVTEAGASNFFVVWRNDSGAREVVTPPISDGLILDGVTRSSALDVLKGDGIELEGLMVTESKITAADITQASREGRLEEAFVVGTAVLVISVAEIEFRGQRVVLPFGMEDDGTDHKANEIATRLKSRLESIMYGREGSEVHQWAVAID